MLNHQYNHQPPHVCRWYSTNITINRRPKILNRNCHQYWLDNDIKFNSTKSAILTFLPDDKKKYRTPPILMNNEPKREHNRPQCVQYNIPHGPALIRNFIYKFMCRLFKSQNKMLYILARNDCLYESQIRIKVEIIAVCIVKYVLYN